MPEAQHPNVRVVERFLAAFDHRWPSTAELDDLLAPGVTMVERPNMLKPAGGTRDAEQTRAGVEAGRALLVWQAYDPRDHVTEGDTVVTRMRWSGELAVDAGPWPAGTRLSAWCVAHYRIEDGRIASIEQHDCYEQPVLPEGSVERPTHAPGR